MSDSEQQNLPKHPGGEASAKTVSNEREPNAFKLNEIDYANHVHSQHTRFVFVLPTGVL